MRLIDSVDPERTATVRTGRALADAGVKIVDPPLSLFALAGGDGLSAYQDHPEIRKVTGFIASQISTTGLHVYRMKSNGDRVRERNHPMAKFVADPARRPGVTAADFWRDLIQDQLLEDRCAAYFEYDPETLDVKRAVRIPANTAKFHGVDYVERVTWADSDGAARSLRTDKVPMILGSGYSGLGVGGLSPIDTLRGVLEGSAEAAQYRSELMKRRAMIGGVIERATPWSSPEARSRFVSEFGEFVRGRGRAGGTVLLDDGMTYKESASFKPIEVRDLEARELTAIEVATAFWIYPELLGLRKATNSNMQAFRQMLYSVCLGPYYERFEQMLNLALSEAFPNHGLYVEFNRESKLAGSFVEQSETYSRAAGGPYMTRAEVRARENLPYLDGSDELIVPKAVSEGGKASPMDGDKE